MASYSALQTNGNGDRNAISNTKGSDWNAIAQHYKKMTVDVTSDSNALLLKRINTLHPFSQATSILDDGCGPGPIMSRIIAEYSSQIPDGCKLVCTDFSEGMIAQVKDVQAESLAEHPESLWKKVEAKAQNAMDLQSVASGSQSHVTAGLVFFMTPDPRKCLSEVLRVLQQGGILGCSSWEGNQWMDVMRVIGKVVPKKEMPEMPVEWTSTSAVRAELEKAGFRDVETHRVAANMRFEDHRGLCEFFLKALPHMVALTKDLGRQQMDKVLHAMVEEMRRLEPRAPGELKGWVIVGVGRK